MGILRSNTNEFIEKSIKIHGNKYDYSKVNYINCISKISIYCKNHGEFLQSPSAHLSGQGCPKCRYLRDGCGRIKSTEKFVEESIKTHGNIYDYSKSVYLGANRKLVIGCLKHGNFFQTPIGHLHNKHGCPKCNSSRGEIIIRRWLDKNKIKYKEQKTFPDCRNPSTNYPLRFDFYVIDKNILVEYDGEHHFRKMYLGKHHKTTTDLEETKRRDNLKDVYVYEKGIKLVRIPYYNFQNIETILKKEIYGY